jgi:molybdopterin-guanine dinucleotide biosynthesis protein A
LVGFSDVSAVILAGGKSARLGIDKAFLDFGGTPLIARVHAAVAGLFPEIIIVTSNPSAFTFLSARVVPDVLPGRGPLGGLHAGLSALGPHARAAFVVACDLPFIRPDLVARLVELKGAHDAVVPRRGEFAEPLHALYDRACLRVVEEELGRSSPRVTSFFGRVDVRYVGPEEVEVFGPWERLFFNVNRADDYRLALAMTGDAP